MEPMMQSAGTDALDVVREAFVLMLTIAAPILAVGLVVGLVVSILQAVTQIQEQTLPFAVKLIAVIVVIAAFPQIATWLPAVGTTIAKS